MQLLRGSCFIPVNLGENLTPIYSKEILALHFCSPAVSQCSEAAVPYGRMEGQKDLPHAAKPALTLLRRGWGTPGQGHGRSLTALGLREHLCRCCSPGGQGCEQDSQQGFQEGSWFHPSCCSLSHTLKICS